MVSVPELEHSDGCRIPQIGFGTFELSEGEEEARVAEAVEAGYRMLDTATIYRNEAEVGAAIRNSGIARDQFFVTTKLWNTDQGADRARRAFDQSQEKLGLAEIDLYLIHWPKGARSVDSDDHVSRGQPAPRAGTVGKNGHYLQPTRGLDNCACRTDRVGHRRARHPPIGIQRVGEDPGGAVRPHLAHHPHRGAPGRPARHHQRRHARRRPRRR